MLREVKGCDLCGDFPVSLRARCHPTAPLKADMLDGNTLVLSCYLPSCGQEVARLSVAGDGMVVVPREPTQDMIGAGWQEYDGTLTTVQNAKAIYRAMILAAQGGGP